jgi:hypothetical protein
LRVTIGYYPDFIDRGQATNIHRILFFYCNTMGKILRVIFSSRLTAEFHVFDLLLIESVIRYIKFIGMWLAFAYRSTGR